jgi:hypothetical protein
MSSGIAQVVYPARFMLSVWCSAVSGRMLVAERESLSSQAWLASGCFGLRTGLAALSFWRAV